MSIPDFIPDGFVPLADWDYRERQKQDGHSEEWKILGAAAKAGELPAFKLSNGRWYVHRARAVELLAKSTGRTAACSSKAKSAETQVGTLSEIRDGLSSLLSTLERIAIAAESIATQPRAELHTINGNPAPWNET